MTSGRQYWEIILRWEGEKPSLPAPCTYLPYPGSTFQPPDAERVLETPDRTQAFDGWQKLQKVSHIIQLELFHGGEKVRHWARPGSCYDL